ncbi:MAG: hypothetical protein Fues2KO_26030 [Fuerstiella sp.]
MVGYSGSKLGGGSKGVKGAAGSVVKGGWGLLWLPFRFVWRICVWLANNIGKWWNDRKLKHLLYGLPAMLLIGVCLYFLIGHRSTNNIERASRYLRAGQSAYRNQNWKTASLFLSRALELGLKDDDAKFQLADVSEKTDDMARRAALLRELAPPDQARHAPAHLWRATQAIEAGRLSAEGLQEAILHLQLALQKEPNNRIAHSILGDIRFQQGDLQAAIFHLEASDPVVARNSLQLAKALSVSGRRNEALAYARKAREQARQVLNENPGDVVNRVALSETLAMMEDFEQAVDVISERLSESQPDENLRKQLARVYLLWAEHIRETEAASQTRDIKIFQLLAYAAEYDPQNGLVFDRMMATLSGANGTIDYARELLLKNIIQGIAAGMSHLVLGTMADEADSDSDAGFHLERAASLLNNAPIVMNNLAWYLSHRPTPDLPQALNVINKVLADHAEVPAFRETRGQILAMLDQPQAALEDLEFALPHFRRNANLHRTLSKVYEKLGVPGLAAEHRELAEMLDETTETDESAETSKNP